MPKGYIWTDEAFKNEMKQRKPHIAILSKYEHSKKKVLCHCEIHNFKWSVTPSDLLTGHGCPECKRENQAKRMRGKVRTNYRRWNHEDFVKEIKNKTPQIEILSKFKSVTKKIECRCNKHNEIFWITGNALMQGQQCPICSKEQADSKRTKTHEQFVEEMKTVHPDLEVLTKYEHSFKYITVKCLKCGYKYEATPTNLISTCGNCPNCESVLSHGESAIKEYLMQNNIEYNTQYIFDDCRDIAPLPFDFAVKNKNTVILIEYDGEQHFRVVEHWGGKEGFEDRKKKDKIKDEYCRTHNIPLLRIPYWEFNNLETILDNFLNKFELVA